MRKVTQTVIPDKLNEFEKAEVKTVNIKIHFALTCTAYLFLGIGMCVQQMGIKAGLGFYPTTIIFSSCLIFWLIVIFTSMEKVKAVLYKKETDAASPLTPPNQ